MKILAINGSPNAAGSTAKLIDMLVHVCSDLGAKCEKVNLEDYEIEGCRDCNRCTEVGECVHEDDFIHLKALMTDADGIIIGSPYYDGGTTDILNTLFLRLSKSESINKFLKGKYFIGLATSASDNCKHLAQYCANLGEHSLKSNLKVSGTIYINTINSDDIMDITNIGKLKNTIIKTGKNFVKDIAKTRSDIYLKIRCYFYTLFR